jgi:1-acyl-sn-glycerol-3-phosphate acyltransferase
LAFRFLNALLRLGLWLGRIRVIVEGQENVPDEAGVIVASNHLSIADPILVCVTVERLVRRRVRYMAKSEAFGWPVLGPLMTAYGGFGVRRGRPDRDAYRMAREVLASGDWLGLAPEGTRSRTGMLGEPKQGVALLAVRAAAPILPVGISGTDLLWPVGGRFPRLGTTVTLRFGAVVRPSVADADLRGAGRERVSTQTDELMRRIAELLPARYRGHWGQNASR